MLTQKSTKLFACRNLLLRPQYNHGGNPVRAGPAGRERTQADNQPEPYATKTKT